MNPNNRDSHEEIEELRKEARILGIPRRQFFTLLVAGGLAGVMGALATRRVGKTPALPAEPKKTEPWVYKPVPEEFFLERENNYETRLEVLAGRGYLTPNSLFFVRSHAPTPLVDARTWRLSIGGEAVDRPFELSYDELLKMPSRTVTRFIECAGNGREFYSTLLHQPVEGNSWRLGAYGIAEWTGVPLADVLRKAGIKRTAADVLVSSLDSKSIERPLPVVKAMEEDTLLAYYMNGEILPRDHGFPLRLVAPGWAGIANIKWVGRITVSERSVFVEMNTEDYVLIGPDYASELPARGKIITTLPVKSACLLPWPAVLTAGQQVVSGYAWSPFGKIALVEVSLDGGKTYRDATLTGPNIERAGTRWEFTFTATPGDMTITPRATDERGNRQYDISAQKWNKLGYLFGAVVPHPVTIL